MRVGALTRVGAVLAVLAPGCTDEPPLVPPDPAVLLAEGDLEGALAAAPGTPLGPTAARLQALGPQRAAVQAVEGQMLREAAAAALAEGDLARGGRILGTARSALPADTSLAELERSLEAALRDAPPAARAAALQGLAEGSDADPDRRRHLEGQAARAAMLARYQVDTLPETLATQRGVDVRAAGRLLRLVDTEFHVAPDWAAASGAGLGAVATLAASGGAQATWPRVSDAPVPPPTAGDVHGALADLERAVVSLGAAGVPEGTIVDTYVSGALSSLDPWTRAVWPAEIAAWEAGNAGVVQGVGLELEAHEGEVVVTRPLPDTTAWTSGVHQDDVLERIRDDDSDIVLARVAPEARLAVAEDRLLGPPGTAVVLTVRAPGARSRDVALIRGPVVTETVQGWQRGPDNAWDPFLDREAGLAYVRILRFKPPTEAAFDDLLAPWLDEVRGVVLDLRGNPGGDVNAAVQIADRFVADGWLANLSGRVLPDTGPELDPRTGEALAAWNQAIPGHALEGVPVVVLVDSEVASAAELLAGALQERAGATVVGAPTWGKGRAQALRVDPEGGFAVQFTNVVWTLPSGRRLARDLPDGGGIVPDLAVALSPAEQYQTDRQARARAALRVHADGTPLRFEDPGRRRDLPPLDADPVVLAGELALRARLLEAAPPSVRPPR